jgi:hypothetical protein
MNDFQVAYEEGIRAFQDATRAKAEIDAVLLEFSNQVHRASEGGVERVTGVQSMVPMSAALLHAAAKAQVDPPTRQKQALVAVGKGGSRSSPICEIQISPEGYPVRLSYADNVVFCHDKASLEVGLVNLLKHPETGAIFAKLMRDEANH